MSHSSPLLSLPGHAARSEAEAHVSSADVQRKEAEFFPQSRVHLYDPVEAPGVALGGQLQIILILFITLNDLYVSFYLISLCLI